MARRHLGPEGFPQAASAAKHAAELRRARSLAGRWADYLLWDYAGGRDWYQRAHADLVRLYGNDTEAYVLHLAATSPQSDIVRNVALADDAFARTKRGEPVQGDLPCHVSNLERIRRGEPLSGYKVREFARALCGDWSAIVVDTWMLRAAGMSDLDIGSSRGLNSTFRVAHEAVRQLAEEHGWHPCEVQAAVWVAYRAANVSRNVSGSFYFEFLQERTAA